jgi:lipoprotein-releasing system ATP-binding protein
MTMLALKQIEKTYAQGAERLHVLAGLDVSLQAGEVVALVGQSGSGKTTLLHIAGLLDVPDKGEVVIAGINAEKANDAKRTELRRHHIGFVYQFHHLLPEFSALENVAVPQIIAGIAKKTALQKAEGLLRSLGLGERLQHRPSQLSGGEQQRVAIARALANSPSLLLADEPTGNLDPESAEQVFALLMQQARTHHLAVLVATHNLELAGRMDRIVRLHKGTLQ